MIAFYVQNITRREEITHLVHAISLHNMLLTFYELPFISTAMPTHEGGYNPQRLSRNVVSLTPLSVLPGIDLTWCFSEAGV